MEKAKHYRKVVLLLMAVSIYVLADLSLGLAVIPRSFDTFRVPHPFYHHGFVPMQAETDSFRGHQYPIFTNSLGLRDREACQIDIEDDQDRIVVIGDSFVEGQGVVFEQTVVGLLQSYHSSSGVQVLNAGVASYSPRLYLLKMRWLVEQQGLRFDDLVVFVDLSDIANEIVYQHFEPGAFGRDELNRFRFARWLKRRSATVYAVDLVSGRTHNPLLNPVFRSSTELLSKDELMIVHNSFDYEFLASWVRDDAALHAWGRRGLELASNHLSELKDLCDKIGAGMSLVVYPWPNQIFWGDRESLQLRFWRQFAKREGVRFINLYPVFFSAGSPAQVHEKLFIRYDVHWNASGHRVVADQILEAWSESPPQLKLAIE